MMLYVLALIVQGRRGVEGGAFLTLQEHLSTFDPTMNLPPS